MGTLDPRWAAGGFVSGPRSDSRPFGSREFTLAGVGGRPPRVALISNSWSDGCSRRSRFKERGQQKSRGRRGSGGGGPACGGTAVA